jgi:DNA mismatch repair protein MutS2
MKQGANRRLANVKTRTETGLEYVMQSLDLNTPFGKKLLKETRPFYPGEEEQLRQELDKVDGMMSFVRAGEKQVSKMQETFMMMKDLSFTLERSHKDVLSVVELFEVKSLLLQMKSLDKICSEHAVPDEFVLEDVEGLLDCLDPRHDRLNTFYIYDDFSEKLADLRKKKHGYEISIRKAQKARKEEIRKKYGIMLTPKFDVIISRSSEDLEKAKQISDLEQVSEDYMSVTFELGKSPEIYGFVKDMENVNGEIGRRN